MGFETLLVDSSVRMHSLLDKADAYPDNERVLLMEAAVVGCNALTSLTKSRDFRRTIDEMDELRKANTSKFKKILSDLEVFEEFLDEELALLIKGGFPEALAEQVVNWCRDVRGQVLKRARTPDEITANVDRLRDEACRFSEELKSKVQEEKETRKAKQRLRKLMMGVAGYALTGLNAAIGIAGGVTTAIPTAGASILLGAAGVAASAALGSQIAGSAASRDTASDSRAASASA